MIARHPCIRCRDARPQGGADWMDVVRSVADHRTQGLAYGHATREIKALDSAAVGASPAVVGLLSSPRSRPPPATKRPDPGLPPPPL